MCSTSAACAHAAQASPARRLLTCAASERAPAGTSCSAPLPTGCFFSLCVCVCVRACVCACVCVHMRCAHACPCIRMYRGGVRAMSPGTGAQTCSNASVAWHRPHPIRGVASHSECLSEHNCNKRGCD